MIARKALLYFIAFLSGAVVLAFEIVAGRFLQPAFGSTIQVWGIVIGVFLAALSIGYYLGGHLADRYTSFFAFSVLLMISGAILLGLPLFATEVRDLVFDKLSLETVVTLGPLFSSLSLFLAPTVILGMVSPYAVRLLADDPARLGRQVGTLYAVSTLGSILGAIGTSIYLTYWIGTKKTMYLLGGIQIGLAGIALWRAIFEHARSRSPARSFNPESKIQNPK